MAQRALTIRISEQVFDDLGAYAEQHRSTVADVIRQSIGEKIGGVSNAELLREIKAIGAAVSTLTVEAE